MSLIDVNARIGSLELPQIKQEFRRLLEYLDHDLTFDDNFLLVRITVTDTGVAADTDFSVTHQLGKVPTFYLWNAAGKAFIYDGSGGRGVWTSETIQLRCSLANAAVILLVM